MMSIVDKEGIIIYQISEEEMQKLILVSLKKMLFLRVTMEQDKF